MSEKRIEQQDHVLKFFADVFEISEEQFIRASNLSDFPEGLPEDIPSKMPGVISLKNQPEFAADAPWRLEPDLDCLPIVFYIRDADSASSANGPWKLDLLIVEQIYSEGNSDKIVTFLPENLPNVDKNGQFANNFWSYEAKIPLIDLKDTKPGTTIRLRIKFIGGFPPYDESETPVRYLETMYAKYPLPCSRAAHQFGPRRWFYGDTHYHSAYTNDIKEYGGTIHATRLAGQSVGLDWVVITDHSVDLDEEDIGMEGKTRWERLKAELASPEISDDWFRFILGEEITLFGKDKRIVHMLAIGGLKEMIPGAFLPDIGGGLQTSIYRKAIEKLVQCGKGYPKDIPKRLFGKLHNLNEVYSLLPEDTLTFAAHPYDVAQVPPAKWADEDLSNPRLSGHEFWNARIRKKARFTDNPFTSSSWTDLDKLAQNDRERIEKIQERVIKKWDHFLKSGVDRWLPESNMPLQRPVFIAGTDAHGDFNYHAGMAWDYSGFDLVDDNALGKVRTVLHLPNFQDDHLPSVDLIIEALKKGACVVTDGPIIEIKASCNEHNSYMGDVLKVSADAEPEIRLTVHSTPEFGPMQQVEIVTYFKGQEERTPIITPVEAGQTETLAMGGNQGYCRVQAQSMGVSGERYCCFTNPVWIRAEDDQIRTMQVSLDRIDD